jgi:hypothetical protein
MAAAGLFERSQGDSEGKTLGAALGLVGAVISAVITLVGTMIKYSLDDRNARQAAVEASRNYALAVEAEQRNRIEAAIRAVDLLSENNKDATESQMGGALLALASLGELDLAISLLAQLWPGGLVSAPVADVVLQAAFRSESEQTQKSASTVLAQNAKRIDQGVYHIWPLPDVGWRTNLPHNARVALVCAAGEWLISEIATRPYELSSSSIVLYQALEDPDEYVRDISAACLRPYVEQISDDAWIFFKEGRLSASRIKESLTCCPTATHTSYGIDFQKRITDFYGARSAGPQ